MYIIDPICEYWLQGSNLNGGPADSEYIMTKFWKPTEHLWKGKMVASLISLNDPHDIYDQSILPYFESESYKKVKDITYRWNTMDDLEMENFLKLVWLSKIYNGSGFINPLPVHWNPRLQQNVVHPGGCRKKAVQLFNTDEYLDILYFNTGGFYDTDTMGNLEQADVKQMEDEGWGITWVPDHGAMIPHPLRNVDMIPGGIAAIQEEMREKLSSKHFRIYIDPAIQHKYLRLVNPWLTDNSKMADVVVKAKDSEITLNDILGIIVASIGEFNVDLPAYTVKSKNKVL